MNQIQAKVLQHLLDSYENSKTFLEKNKVSQNFSIYVGRLFPRYNDDSEYDLFCHVNESLKELEDLSFVFLEREKNGVLKKVVLNLDKLNECYKVLGRISRKEEQARITELWDKLRQECQGTDGKLQPLWDYIEVQKGRMADNKNIEYYEQDMEDYSELLKLTVAALSNEQEMFIRTFSIQLFADSKRLEQLTPRLKALLFCYGEYDDKDSVLEECGIVQTPTYIMLKGNARLQLGTQSIDLSQIEGDMALSTSSIKELQQIEVFGERIVTIENLTTFHEYPADGDFVIYLGGFHNKVKREFLLFLFKQNSYKEYRHFGDIDAGGFYILEHLKRKTGISFMSLMMDREVLKVYQESTMPLTANDRRRLQALYDELTRQVTDGTAVEDYRATLVYMLEQNCKLEQEVVEISK